MHLIKCCRERSQGEHRRIWDFVYGIDPFGGRERERERENDLGMIVSRRFESVLVINHDQMN